MKEDQDFDQEVFNALKEMMKDRFPVLAEKFTRNAAVYVRKAEQAVLAGDNEGIIQNAHALKSSSAMLGFIGFQRCAAQIEAKARKGEANFREDILSLRAYLEHSSKILAPYL